MERGFLVPKKPSGGFEIEVGDFAVTSEKKTCLGGFFGTYKTLGATKHCFRLGRSIRLCPENAQSAVGPRAVSGVIVER